MSSCPILVDVIRVIPLLHFDPSSPDGPRLFLPYVKGGSLKSRIGTTSLSDVQVLAIFARLAETMTCIHAAGVLHLDIKPSNLLVDSAGRPLLIDFGHAILLESVLESQVEALSAQALHNLRRRLERPPGGTWEYMAPEQFFAPASHLTPAADVFAFGMSLWQALGGRIASTPVYEEQMQMKRTHYELHCRGPDELISEIAPRLRSFRELEGLLRRLLQADPQDRITDMNFVSEVLKGLARQDNQYSAPY